jgi:exodeoxyribonuclease VII large subunit
MELTVSEFVAVLNQTLDYAYGSVVIYGELANLRITKNRWVYFDLKDETAKVAFFGSVYNLPGPLENGMMLRVKGTPRYHPQYEFSVVISSISAAGSGSIKRLSELLAAKLEQEGLFASVRKRGIPYPPRRIGLITSIQSAAFADFNKIINERWVGVQIDCYDVNVQGDQAPTQIIRAIDYFNAQAKPPEVLVIIRGGGSPEDLAAFSTEQVTRSVAASRVPTLIAIGHESDISLAELAADKRASTPSNAAELLVPDKQAIALSLNQVPAHLSALALSKIRLNNDKLKDLSLRMSGIVETKLRVEKQSLTNYFGLLEALSPIDVLRRGYAIVRQNGIVSGGESLKINDIINIQLTKWDLEVAVTKISKDKND